MEYRDRNRNSTLEPMASANLDSLLMNWTRPIFLSLLDLINLSIKHWFILLNKKFLRDFFSFVKKFNLIIFLFILWLKFNLLINSNLLYTLILSLKILHRRKLSSIKHYFFNHLFFKEIFFSLPVKAISFNLSTNSGKVFLKRISRESFSRKFLKKF